MSAMAKYLLNEAAVAKARIAHRCPPVRARQ